VKLTRTFFAIAVLAAVVVSSRAAYASSGCPDDPERCVERGAATSHRAVITAPATVAITAPAHTAPATALAHNKAPVATPARKSAGKSARVVTPATPVPATPGMGMLLKLSSGSGGEVSLFPSKPTEKTSEASWVL
jgi:hypothetical protein